MISSIFGRTNPINFIILVVFLSFFLMGGYFFYLDFNITWNTLPLMLKSLCMVFLSVFMVDFIVRKNQLTHRNSFAVLFFVLLFCLFPKIFNEFSLLVSNFFILLALRRVVSLHSNRDIEIKIFDATLWILVAAYFYSWAILFILIVFCALFLYKKNDYRNVLIPFVAFFIVMVLVFTYYFMTDQTAKMQAIINFYPKFAIEKYEDRRYVVPLVFLCVMGGWACILFLLKKQSKPFKSRVPGILITITLAISILVAIISETANTSELIYVLFPLSIILAKYVERIKKQWLKEGILWAFIIMPFVVLFL